MESILFPSQVISDQYASKTVLTTDGRSITGLVAPQADGSLIVLQSNGQKASIAGEDIDKTIPSKISAMPEGLLNTLTLEEIANLFAYSGPTSRCQYRRAQRNHGWQAVASLELISRHCRRCSDRCPQPLSNG